MEYYLRSESFARLTSASDPFSLSPPPAPLRRPSPSPTTLPFLHPSLTSRPRRSPSPPLPFLRPSMATRVSSNPDRSSSISPVFHRADSPHPELDFRRSASDSDPPAFRSGAGRALPAFGLSGASTSPNRAFMSPSPEVSMASLPPPPGIASSSENEDDLQAPPELVSTESDVRGCYKMCPSLFH